MNAEYEDFLCSADWKDTSRQLKEEHPYCEICHSKQNLVVHHKCYGNNLLDREALVVLCSDCHECFHKALNKYMALYNQNHLLMYRDVQKLLSETALDFYKNSFRKSDSNINILDASSNQKKRFYSFLKEGLHLRFSWHPIFISDQTRCSVLDVNFSAKANDEIIAYRNHVIKEALNEGVPDFIIKKQFKLSNNAFSKVITRIQDGEDLC